MLLRCAQLLFWLVIVGALTSSVSLLGSRAAWREVFAASDDFESDERQCPAASVFALDTSADGATILCCLRGEGTGDIPLLIGSDDGRVCRVSAVDGRIIQGPFLKAGLLPDGKSLLIADTGFGVARVDLASGEMIRVRTADTSSNVTKLAVAPCGRFFAMASGSEVLVCDARDGRARSRLQGSASSVADIAFSPDGTRMATARGNGDIQLWNSDTGELEHVLTGHAGPATCIRFAGSGARLASVGMDGTLRLWDASSGELLWTKSVDGYGLRGLAVCPHGRTAAVGGFGGIIHVYDFASRDEREILEGHAKAVTALRFASNGALLVSTGDDGTIRHWDSAAHFSPIRCIHVNASSR